MFQGLIFQVLGVQKCRKTGIVFRFGVWINFLTRLTLHPLSLPPPEILDEKLHEYNRVLLHYKDIIENFTFLLLVPSPGSVVHFSAHLTLR